MFVCRQVSKSRRLFCQSANFGMQGKNMYHGGASEERKCTVAIEGNIASGKTTLLQYFSKFEDALVYQEPVDKWRSVKGHNLLGYMYSDPPRWSLAFQTYVQLTMIDQHKSVIPSEKRVKLMERSLFSAKYCFVENLFQSSRMTEVEYAILTEWFDWLVANDNPHLDLIVYLRTDPAVCWNRIQARHRPEEIHIPKEYLYNLHDLHEDWLIGRRKFSVPCPVLVLDANGDLRKMEHLFGQHCDEILCNNGRAISAQSLVR